MRGGSALCLIRVILVIVLCIVVIFVFWYRLFSYSKEGFANTDINNPCQPFETCSTCTDASGCAWRSDTHQCVKYAPHQIIKGAIFTSMKCETNTVPNAEPTALFPPPLIADRPKPPNVGIVYQLWEIWLVSSREKKAYPHESSCLPNLLSSNYAMRISKNSPRW